MNIRMKWRQRYNRLSPNHLTIIFFLCFTLSMPIVANADFYSSTLPRMQAKFESISDYRCLYRAYSAQNGKSTDVSFHYYFMKPKQIRMEIINGRYPGTVLLYDAQKKPDKVKVRVGNPVLAVMQRAIYGDYFHHSDKKVTDLGGFGVLESDWGWFIDIHREMARWGRVESSKEVVFEGRPALYYRLVSTNPEKTLSVATEELWIDKHLLAPMKFVEYDRYGNIIRQVEYKNLTIDVGLNQELFTTFDADNHKQPQDRYVK